MKHIIVAITPDADGVRCGECRYRHYEIGRGTSCHVHGGQLYFRDPHIAGMDTPKRHPACLAAERKLAALIEAGNKFADREQYAHGKTDVVVEWDRAVADIKEERK